MMQVTEAVVFGNLNAAVFLADESYYVLDEGAGQEPRPCRAGEITSYLSLDPSSTVITDVHDLVALRHHIGQEKRKCDALFFFLASLDTRVRPENRVSAAELSNELIADSAVYNHIRSILLSEPLRGQLGDLDSEAFRALEHYYRLRDELKEQQSAVQAFWKHWDRLEQDASFAKAGVDSAALREALLSVGAVPKFVASIKERRVPSFNAELVAFALNPDVQRSIPHAQRALSLLRNSLESEGVFAQDRLFPTTVDEQQDEARPGRRIQPHPAFASRATFEQVSKQIEGIRRLLTTGSMSNVTKAVGDLLESQREGGAEYLAKTLCNLASIAIDTNEPHLAKYLSDRAVELGEEDVVIYTTRAEVFKRLGKFDDAKHAYEATIARFGRDRYAINGYADVLMDAGLYKESLAIYNDTLRQYPDDPVAANGIATVLSVSGQTEAALRLAQKNVAIYGDGVSRVICGNLLRHVGRYTEALRLARESVHVLPQEIMLWYALVRSLALKRNFEAALKEAHTMAQRFPETPLPWLAKGDTLSRAGDIQGSLDTYSTALKTFTSHRPLQIGRASMLILLGRHPEAAELLDGLAGC